MRKRISLLFVALMLALTMAFSSVAFAGHRGETHGNQEAVNTACTSPGSGNVIPGQGTTCQGGGLDQQTETRNQGGNAPPGQN